ncbi:Putative transcriptional regulator%2C TetR family (tetracyclin resistance) [Mycobacteroides abscessus]|nr:Putative transcriptional regulator%2C TetR family (tetracyclin resistance) [Mycobacteroides abscessus]
MNWKAITPIPTADAYEMITGSEYPGPNPYTEENLLAKLDLHKYPAVAEAFSEIYDPDFDADFEDGLTIIIDGLRARLHAKRKSAAPRVTTRR